MLCWVLTRHQILHKSPRTAQLTKLRLHVAGTPISGVWSLSARAKSSSSEKMGRPPAANIPVPKHFGTSRSVSILPFEVVQRIASGEIIAGYRSVLQELVENSIDAQSTAISIDLDFINHAVTVEDNGIGISIEQGLVDIARCNATSKLRSLKQLNEGVSTLGFRGQGLWAIAMTVGSLDVSSRPHDVLSGTSITFSSDGSPQMNSISPVAMSCGTIVRACHLPWVSEGNDSRRIFKQCKDWISRTALCHPSTSFRLTRNGQAAWQSISPNENETEAQLAALAKEMKASCNDFRTASSAIPGFGYVSLVVGLPSTVHYFSKSWMVISVDGRCVHLESLTQAICSACQVRKGRYPVAFVRVETRRGLVNWNISPMKSAIRFNEPKFEGLLIDVVAALVSDSLKGLTSKHMLEDTGVSEVPHKLLGPSLASQTQNGSLKGILSLLSQKQQALKGVPTRDLHDETTPNSFLFGATVVAQVLNTYILVEHTGGIILIEQHVADERALYEKLLSSWKESQFVKLEEPIQLPSPMKDEWIFVLTSLGFDMDHDHFDVDMMSASYVIYAVPDVMASIPKSALRQIILRLCVEASTIEEAAASVACKLATKNGLSLDTMKMNAILKNLLSCENPHTCPHGRPIFFELHTKELASLFGRSWNPERTGRSPDVGNVRKNPSSIGLKRGILEELPDSP